MQLNYITLHNIRSYQNQTIPFSEGITLLAGDIGVGKSTILLAIEFALFGSSRTELPAELLLRKGTTQGYVELCFLINNQEIIVRRGLKKENDTIKQLAGHIIKNGVKKDLMPVELKSELLTLLGYPSEILSKNKNYIYRYTVYTPQEEMKHILEQDAESRLDVLRKIFNLDKYKTIRENTAIYCKNLRNEITISKTKCEPLPNHLKTQEQLQQQRESKEQEIAVLQPQYELAAQEHKTCRTLRENLQKDQIKATLIQQRKASCEAVLQQQQRQHQQLTQQHQHLTQKLLILPPQTQNLQERKIEITNLEQEQQQHNSKIASLQQLSQQLHKQITQLHTQTHQFESQIATFTQKEQEKVRIEQELAKTINLNQELEISNRTLNEVTAIIVTQQTLLTQSQNIERNFQQLATCPTCLQEVSSEYKHSILNTQHQTQHEIVTILTHKKQEETTLLTQQRSLQQQQEQRRKYEQQHVQLHTELLSLIEKKTQHQQLRTHIQTLSIEHNATLKELATINNPEKITQLQQRLIHLHTTIEKERERQLLQEQQLQITKSIHQLEEEIEKNRQILQKEETEFSKYSAIAQKLQDCLHQEEILQIKLNTKALQKVKGETEHTAILTTQKELNKIITQLEKEKQHLLHIQQLNMWLEDHFMALTLTIEKHVMVTIHQLFNELFRDWFGLLMQDDTINARIDDTFNPIIEQNGHEISFSNLSGGEKTSCALAYRLALNRVINDVIHEVKTKDLLILDEPTDGFSSEQLDRVRDVLEKLNLKQIIIVSHEAKIESFVDHIIRIKKDSHISEVW